MRVDQVQRIIGAYMENSGRGGFMTGTVKSVEPLIINAGAKLVLEADDIYIADNCTELILKLRHKHDGGEEQLLDKIVLREGLKKGDGVLILTRPDNVDGVKYIIVDKIRKFTATREVSGK